MTVAIKKVGADIGEAVSAAMDLARYEDFIPRGSTVYLKVNLGWDLFLPGSVTNPAFFEAVVLKLKGYAGKLFVVESDQVLENVEKAYRKSRISEIAERLDVPWINLSRGGRVIRYMPSNKIMKEVSVPAILSEGVTVTLPVMKTHGKSTVTLSLKNQWGCLPKMRHMYHLDLTEAIADVNAAVGVKFAVVDGTIAMEGNGPKTGILREVGIVGAGADLVEVDAVFARLMGFDPRGIAHLVEAERRGIGKIGVDYVGDRIDDMKPFKPAGHNIVSRVELACRRSFLRALIFETPLFMLMVAGAKIYYYFYELVKGKKTRRHYRKCGAYGAYFSRSKRR